MGSALARALFNKRFSTTVWNRTRSKTEPLAQLGIRVAPSLQAAAMACGVVIVNVVDYNTTLQLLHAPDVASALLGKTLVQLSSGTPQEARRMESWAMQHKISYLDGAIMSYPSGIGTPECTIFYSGAEESFARVKPLLLALGGNPMFVGTAIGHACALDLAGLVSFKAALFLIMRAFPPESLRNRSKPCCLLWEEFLKPWLRESRRRIIRAMRPPSRPGPLARKS
jgi:3-hydroxyisobutyrate dehydrogenase-like beta-hydroxyacid dehydrogenase